MSKGNRNKKVSTGDIHIQDSEQKADNNFSDQINHFNEDTVYDHSNEIQEDLIFSKERERYLARKSRTSNIQI